MEHRINVEKQKVFHIQIKFKFAREKAAQKWVIISVRKRGFLLNKLNDMKLGHKLRIMQIFCVLLPLLITDSIIVSIMINTERKADAVEMRNIADSVQYTLEGAITNAVNLMQSIYSDTYANDFIEDTFTTGLDYYEKQYDFKRSSLFAISANSALVTISIYADNDGIINGGNIYNVQKVVHEPWYEAIIGNNKDILMFSGFEDNITNSRRTIFLVRRMDYLHKGTGASVIKADLNYSNLLRSIINAKYLSKVYVCEGDKILLSNDGRGGPYVEFDRISQTQLQNIAVHNKVTYYGNTLDIYVMAPDTVYFNAILNNLELVLFLIILNLIVPYLLVRLISKSITVRLKKMEEVFGSTASGELFQLPEISGRDEIGQLMTSYNHMAGRMNELIQKEYKDRLKHQEIDIARQKAELLALHSQINPHFLFNALESIRMHSVVKKEFETADMVEKLALMERQNVDWHNDNVKIKEEIRFIEAYLELQKYRFGDKLSYMIDVDEDCVEYRIPKLTLVTFIENACVHGMEAKTSSSWIFVRVTKDKENLIMEIEDTGNGMLEYKRIQLLKEMKEINIQALQKKTEIGILNASLRLRMFSDEQVRFEIDSEPNTGTMVTITIPLACAMKN